MVHTIRETPLYILLFSPQFNPDRTRTNATNCVASGSPIVWLAGRLDSNDLVAIQ
jgi:hypothetical protein